MTFKYFNDCYFLFLYFFIKKFLLLVDFFFCFFMTFFAEIGSIQDIRFLKIKYKASSFLNMCRIWLVTKHVQQLIHKKIHNNSTFFLYPNKRFYG